MTDVARIAARLSELTPIERRVLAYLDQKGATHRSYMAGDLSKDDSRTARHQNGTNGAVPLIVGKWCRRLKQRGLVRENREYGTDAYISHEITASGKEMLRSAKP